MKRFLIRASIITCLLAAGGGGIALIVQRGTSTAAASDAAPASDNSSTIAFRGQVTPAGGASAAGGESRGAQLAFATGDRDRGDDGRYATILAGGASAGDSDGAPAAAASRGSFGSSSGGSTAGERYPQLQSALREPARFPEPTLATPQGAAAVDDMTDSASAAVGETSAARGGTSALSFAPTAADSDEPSAIDSSDSRLELSQVPTAADGSASGALGGRYSSSGTSATTLPVLPPADPFGANSAALGAPQTPSSTTQTPSSATQTQSGTSQPPLGASNDRYSRSSASAFGQPSAAASATAGDSSPLGGASRAFSSHAALGASPSSLASSSSASGTPGAQALEGPQSPSLVVEKIAPDEIQVGKPATFEIHVRNVGTAAAQAVELRDVVPRGTQLSSTNPRADQSAGGQLVWSVGTLRPGQEFAAQIELMPVEEGEIGSVATVHFSAEASVRTICTRPQLEIDVSAPTSVLIGDEVVFRIRVTNPGTGVATGVVLEEHVPDSLEHAAGPDLVYDVGDLGPRETRELDLTMTARRAGKVLNMLTARGDAQLVAEGPSEIEIVAPALALGVDGPRRRYLDRQATYTVSVTNPGTAAAREVALITYLPPGLQFVEANNAGEYDARSRSVHWLLEELPPNEVGTVTFVTVPVEAGEYTLRVESTADLGVEARTEEPITVEGVAHLVYQVLDLADPIEVGGESTYEIQLMNQGTKAATNVQIAAILSSELQATAVEGPVRYQSSGDQIRFEPLARLEPKEEVVFRIAARGVQAGDARIRVQLTSDDTRAPVTKEENTRVYADE